MEVVANSQMGQPVVLTRDEIINKLRWQDRFFSRTRQNFPISGFYRPLDKKIVEFYEKISKCNRGYIGILGSPGIGKSSFLAHIIPKNNMRIIKYFIHLESSLETVTFRAEAENFMHDTILKLEKMGFKSKIKTIRFNLSMLQKFFQEILDKLGEDFKKNNVKTLFIIDGIDHIEREKAPSFSLINILLEPNQIPDGVFFILGTQTTRSLPPKIKNSLENHNRKIELQNLTKDIVMNIINKFDISLSLIPQQKELIFTKSNGHPLALIYLLKQISELEDINELKEILESSISYNENIEEFYYSHWNLIEKDNDIIDFFGLISRLRGYIDINWVIETFGRNKFQILRKFYHYFRRERKNRLFFFHSSFKEFLIRKTQEYTPDLKILDVNKSYHEELAKLISNSQLSKKNLLKWEVLYHYHQAEQHEKVLEIGTQNYFRQQFFNFRPIEDILRDIQYAIKSTKILSDIIALIRLTLIGAEIYQRKQNHSQFFSEFFTILLSSSKIDLILDYCRNGFQLNVPKEIALELAVKLVNYANNSESGGKNEKFQEILNESKKLFYLAEPLEFFSKEPMDISEREHDLLINWAKAAPFFLSSSETIKKLNQIEIIPRGTEESDLSRRYRNKLLLTIITTILNQNSSSNNWKIVNDLENSLDLNNNEDFTIWYWIQFIKHKKYMENGEIDKDDTIFKTPTLYENRLSLELPPRLRIQLSKMILLEGAELVKSKKIIEDLSTPFNLNKFVYYNFLDGKDIFLETITLLSLRVAFNELNKEDIKIKSPAGLKHSEKAAYYFREAVLIIADILGHIWAEDFYQNSKITELTNQILDLFKKFQVSDKYKLAMNSTPWFELFNQLITIYSKYYSNSLNTLKFIFLNEWENSTRDLLWPINYQRDLLLSFSQYFSDKKWIKEKLLSLDSKMLEGNDGYGRLSQLYKHSLAFLQLNDITTANEYLGPIMRETFRISWRKDYQFDSFIKFFSTLITVNPKLAGNKISWFTSAIIELKNLTEDPAGYSASKQLLKYSFKLSPNCTIKLFSWFLEHESLNYFSGISSILISALDINDFNLNIAKLFMEYYFIPLSKNIPSIFLKKLITIITKKFGVEDAKNYAKKLILRIKVYALPSKRDEWYIEISKIITNLGISIINLGINSDQIQPKYSNDYLELQDGTKLNIIELLERVNSFQEFLEIWSKKKESSYFPFGILIQRLSPDLNLEEIDQLIKIFQDNNGILFILASILFSRDELQKTKDICLNILQNSRSFDWGPWGGRLLQDIFKILVQISTSYIDEIIIPFIVDKITLNSLNFTSAIYFFDEFVSSFIINQDKILIEKIWTETEEYLDHLFDRIELNDKFNWIDNPEEIYSADKAILSIIIENLGSNLDPLQQMSQKICFHLLLDENEQIQTLLLKYLNMVDKYLYGALVVLHATCLQKKGILSNFSNSLLELYKYPNIKYREIIQSIFKCSGSKFSSLENKDSKPFEKLLVTPASVSNISSKVDRIIDFFFRDFLLAISSLSHVSILELQSCIYQLISKQNNEILIDEDYESKNIRHIRNIGLQFLGIKPQFLVVCHAIFQLIAMMIDGDYLLPNLNYLWEFYYFYDPYLLLIEPISRPNYILPVHREDYINEEKLFDQINDLPNIYWVQKSNDQIILAELTQFRILDKLHAAESRICSTFQVNDISVPTGFHFVNQIRIEEYGTINIKIKDVKLIIQNSNLFNKTPGVNWIAFNPNVAKRLGWRLSKDGIFKWIDENGQTMVESIWWADGLISHRGINFCDVGEGWVVVASSTGFEQIKSLGKLKRKSVIKREIFRENVEERTASTEKSF